MHHFRNGGFTFSGRKSGARTINPLTAMSMARDDKAQGMVCAGQKQAVWRLCCEHKGLAATYSENSITIIGHQHCCLIKNWVQWVPGWWENWKAWAQWMTWKCWSGRTNNNKWFAWSSWDLTVHVSFWDRTLNILGWRAHNTGEGSLSGFLKGKCERVHQV